jgi:hypothetical protein
MVAMVCAASPVRVYGVAPLQNQSGILQDVVADGDWFSVASEPEITRPSNSTQTASS